MTKRKICVVTGTRAEYGLLFWLMKEIQDDPELELQIIATGMHLSPEFGLTYKTIEADGFVINEKVEMLLSSDTPVGIAKSMGLGTIGFADALTRLKPDILVLLGDRYEILSAAQVAMVSKIPIAHLCGGDTTEGAFDEAIRHSITKMAHLHFVTNSESKKRVKQLGENPRNIFNVGNPGLDNISRLRLLNKTEFEDAINFKLRKRNLLVTFHPATLDEVEAKDQFSELLKSLDMLGRDIGIIITKPNSDNSGRILIEMIDQYVKYKKNVIVFTSLGQLRYLSAISHVDVVVGNSSSGLLEVPSFQKPTVNIGNRQKGRLQANSVINSPCDKDKIYHSIKDSFDYNFKNVKNPYGDGNSSKRIYTALKELVSPRKLLQKHFFEV